MDVFLPAMREMTARYFNRAGCARTLVNYGSELAVLVGAMGFERRAADANVRDGSP